jgi:hypothetical protein
VLRVSLACKVFLGHPQNYRVCWRGSRPSPVRVSNKQSMQKLVSKNKSIKTRVRQTRLYVIWGWSKFSRCKKKNKKKTENYKKVIKNQILITSSPATAPEKGACWRLIVISKFVYDLQADKSPVVVKGPFFPRVVNPRYWISGTNVWRKSWSSKAK